MLKFFRAVLQRVVDRFSIPEGWQTAEEIEMDRIWKQIAEFDKRVG